MKKVLFMVFASMLLFCTHSCVIDGFNDPEYDIREKSQTAVYFIGLDGCSYSAAAERYIKEKYPNACIRWFHFPDKTANEALKSFNYYFDTGSDRSPWIVFGNKYIQGWSYLDEDKVDVWIQPYLNKSEWNPSN